MTNVAAEKRRITVALNPENSQALRLLAALRGANQKDLVNEFLSRSGLSEALKAEMEGVSHKGTQAAPSAVAQEDKGDKAVGATPSSFVSEGNGDDLYRELVAGEQCNKIQTKAAQDEVSISTDGTTNNTTVSGVKTDDGVPW